MGTQLNYDVSYLYPARPGQDEGIYLPVILSTGATALQTYAYLDTGAKYCIFSYELGLKLGLEIERGFPQTMGSLAGVLETYGHEVTIQTFGFAFESLIYFAKYPGLRRNLLGRLGWLRHFQIGLIDYENSLYLSEYK